MATEKDELIMLDLALRQLDTFAKRVADAALAWKNAHDAYDEAAAHRELLRETKEYEGAMMTFHQCSAAVGARVSLTAEQLEGLACVVCGHDHGDRGMVPAFRVGDRQTFMHEKCP